MRILFLADAVFSDLAGGSRMVARELARELMGRGHEVTFLVARVKPDAPLNDVIEGARVVRYEGAGQGLGFIRSGRAAAAALWAEQPFDVVHSHFAYAALGPLLVIPKSVPHVRSFHGPWDEEGWVEDRGDTRRGVQRLAAIIKKRLRYSIEKSNLRRSDHIFVLSDGFMAQATDRYGISADRVEKVAAGVDMDRFSPPADREGVRKALGLPDNRKILLSVRRLAPRMGLDNLVKAMPAIIARHPEALLLIGGKGPQREHLEHLIREKGLGDHARLIGFISDDHLAMYYGAADLFVLPTVALEGFGLVTVEALACGTPVIGTPVGATPEILRELDERLIASDATADGLAEAVLAFFDGGWSSGLTPDRLRRFVQERYTWDRHTDAAEAIYLRLIAERTHPGTMAPAKGPAAR